jgi:hypothetical protein
VRVVRQKAILCGKQPTYDGEIKNMRNFKLVLGGLAISLVGLTGCSSTECGAGTTAVDGVCTADAVDAVTCDTGSTLTAGKCVVDADTDLTDNNTCGHGTLSDGTACVGKGSDIKPSAKKGFAYANCGDADNTVCTGGALASYWQIEANKNADGDHKKHWDLDICDKDGDDTLDACGQTATIKATGQTDGNWKFVDENDADVTTLSFVQGYPVKLTFTSDDTAQKHYLTAPDFFHSVAWRKAQTPWAEIKAPYFYAFETLTAIEDDAGTSSVDETLTPTIDLYFIPVETGTFEAFCEIATTAGLSGTNKYENRIAETTKTAVAGGHATGTNKMKITITVTAAPAAEGVAGTQTVDHGINLSRPSDFDDKDEVSAGNDDFWKGGTGGTTYSFNGQAVTAQRDCNSGSSSDTGCFAYGHDGTTDNSVELKLDGYNKGAGGTDLTGMTLTAGQSTVLRVSMPSTDTSKHYFTAPSLFATSLFRKAQDAHVEIKAPYFNAIELVGTAADRYVDLYMIPMVKGTHQAYCQIGVKSGAYGQPNYSTGHAGTGMRLTATVE